MDEKIREETRREEPAAAENLDESAPAGQVQRLDESAPAENPDEPGQANRRLDRRTFIRVSALAGAAGVLAHGCGSAGEQDGSAGGGGAGSVGGAGGAGDGPAGLGGDPDALAADLKDNVYTRLLGVRPHIGAHEHLSSMGGSRMPPEVMEAMAEANRYFADMAELHDAAGRRIAEIMGAEAALVSSGAFAAMLVGAAGVLTGSDQERMRLLPNPTWPKVECLFQTAHRFFYDNVFGFAGMKLVEAGTRTEYEAAITDRTALLVGLAYTERQARGIPPFPVRHRQERDPETLMPLEIIEIGRRRGVPVMIDLASNLPPKENLTKYLEAGADLVVVSGGKGIRGPNSTGILAGRADLIHAARMQNAPVNGIGRGLKVGKEEIVGLVAALERYVALDEEEEIAAWNAKARWLADRLQGIDGLEARYELNTHGYCDVELVWDEAVIGLSPDDVDDRLRAGDPRIIYDGPGPRTLQLEDGEVQLVARRLRELFTTVAERTGMADGHPTGSGEAADRLGAGPDNQASGRQGGDRPGGEAGKHLTYEGSGVDYDRIDPLKVLAQRAARSTGANLDGAGAREVAASRGESAYVVDIGDAYLASITECLGTKALVADAMREITGASGVSEATEGRASDATREASASSDAPGRTWYDHIAQDTIATAVNDIVTVGARPLSIHAYWAAGSSDWFDDVERMNDLVAGWKAACDVLGVAWGGGETPCLTGVVEEGAIDLAASCVGIIRPKSRLTLGEDLSAGDAIVLLESSGIHANGLTLARKLSERLPEGYATVLPGGRTYGEALLDPTVLYPPVTEAAFEAGIGLRYIANITGHGWRKIMRHPGGFTYRITETPPVPEVLEFMVAETRQTAEEAYGSLNMGAGFALFVRPEDGDAAVACAEAQGVRAWVAGLVEDGPRQVVIEPSGVTLAGESLALRD